jgi:TusA-related sulfurtransferase
MGIKRRIVQLVESGKIEWKKHALQRMFERAISRAEVKQAIKYGEIIEVYKEDYPFPSFLIASINSDNPLHVVVSYDEEAEICYVITAYVPNTTYFLDDLVTRRKDE